MTSPVFSESSTAPFNAGVDPILLQVVKQRIVAVPNLIEKTYRQAVPTLKSIGLEEGKITYKL